MHFFTNKEHDIIVRRRTRHAGHVILSFIKAEGGHGIACYVTKNGVEPVMACYLPHYGGGGHHGYVMACVVMTCYLHHCGQKDMSWQVIFRIVGRRTWHDRLLWFGGHVMVCYLPYSG